MLFNKACKPIPTLLDPVVLFWSIKAPTATFPAPVVFDFNA